MNVYSQLKLLEIELIDLARCRQRRKQERIEHLTRVLKKVRLARLTHVYVITVSRFAGGAASEGGEQVRTRVQPSSAASRRVLQQDLEEEQSREGLPEAQHGALRHSRQHPGEELDPPQPTGERALRAIQCERNNEVNIVADVGPDDRRAAASLLVDQLLQEATSHGLARAEQDEDSLYAPSSSLVHMLKHRYM